MGCTGSGTANTQVSICPAIGQAFPSTWRLFPNPTHGLFIVDGFTAETLVEVYTLQGERLQSHVATTQQRVDLSAYANGTYMVKLQSEGKVYRMRVVKHE
jgi:hypothetical protein